MATKKDTTGTKKSTTLAEIYKDPNSYTRKVYPTVRDTIGKIKSKFKKK